MSVEAGSDLQLEIGHVLFMDMVGYSKLLVDQQHELQRGLTEIVQSGSVDFWCNGVTGLLNSLWGQVSADVDPDGTVTACRWDVAMLGRDYATARRVLETSSLNEVSYTNAGSTPKTFLQGCSYLAQGDNENAQKAFEMARPSFEASVKEAPLSADRHANLGWLYAFMVRKKEAIHEGHRVVEL